MGQVQQHWPVRHTFVYIVLGQLYTLPSASTTRHLYKYCIVVTTSIYTLAQVQVPPLYTLYRVHHIYLYTQGLAPLFARHIGPLRAPVVVVVGPLWRGTICQTEIASKDQEPPRLQGLPES